jgi:hypothetical protein
MAGFLEEEEEEEEAVLPCLRSVTSVYKRSSK